MDLESRARDLLAAGLTLDAAALGRHFAADAVCEIPGVLRVEGRDALAPFLETLRHNLAALGIRMTALRPTRVASRAGTTFVEWEGLARHGAVERTNRGVLVLAWNEAGEVVHVSIYGDTDLLRRVSVGAVSRAQEPPTAAT